MPSPGNDANSFLECNIHTKDPRLWDEIASSFFKPGATHSLYTIHSLLMEMKQITESGFFILLKTSPEYTQAGVYWEMHVIAKSNHPQWVNKIQRNSF